MLTRLILTSLMVVLFAGAALAGVRDISSRDAKPLLEKDAGIFILDVRTPWENRQGRLARTVLIPFNELGQRLNEIPKNRPVLVYCMVGSRSKQAADYLARQGYTTIYNLSDGIFGWYRNGYPIQR